MYSVQCIAIWRCCCCYSLLLLVATLSGDIFNCSRVVLRPVAAYHLTESHASWRRCRQLGISHNYLVCVCVCVYEYVSAAVRRQIFRHIFSCTCHRVECFLWLWGVDFFTWTRGGVCYVCCLLFCLCMCVCVCMCVCMLLSSICANKPIIATSLRRVLSARIGI